MTDLLTTMTHLLIPALGRERADRARDHRPPVDDRTGDPPIRGHVPADEAGAVAEPSRRVRPAGGTLGA